MPASAKYICSARTVKKQNINGEERIQDSLWRQYFQNKNCLCLILEIPNPTDYMKIVSYYAGDC